MVGISIPSPHIADVLIADGNITVCKGNTTDVQIYYLNILGNLGQSIELIEGVICGILTSVGIIQFIEAVLLIGILGRVNRDGDAVQRQVLVLVAGVLIHVAAQVVDTIIRRSGIILLQQVAFVCKGHGGCFLGLCLHHIKLDGFQQLGIAGSAGDNHLILQCQVALVLDLEALGKEGRTRLPQDIALVIFVHEA